MEVYKYKYNIHFYIHFQFFSYTVLHVCMYVCMYNINIIIHATPTYDDIIRYEIRGLDGMVGIHYYE